MNELHMYRLEMTPERDRRTTEETAGRMFAGIVRAVRRLRGARPVAKRGARPVARRGVVLTARAQTETR